MPNPIVDNLRTFGLRAARRFGGTAVAMIAAVFVASHVQPLYQGHAPSVQQVIDGSWRDNRDSVVARAPWLGTSTEEAIGTAQFQADRKAFAADLRRTGRMDGDRADSLAAIAVREAYRRRVPPALVFGVLLTENPDFRSSARSNVGAVGLMQIHAKTWVRALGREFGTDLKDDETNLRYGVYILSQNVYGSSTWASADSSVRWGLLRYNGCSKGSNTPNCHTYPDKVRGLIERVALAQCGRGGFERCVAEPMRASMEDETITW